MSPQGIIRMIYPNNSDTASRLGINIFKQPALRGGALNTIRARGIVINGPLKLVQARAAQGGAGGPSAPRVRWVGECAARRCGAQAWCRRWRLASAGPRGCADRSSCRAARDGLSSARTPSRPSPLPTHILPRGRAPPSPATNRVTLAPLAVPRYSSPTWTPTRRGAPACQVRRAPRQPCSACSAAPRRAGATRHVAPRRAAAILAGCGVQHGLTHAIGWLAWLRWPRPLFTTPQSPPTAEACATTRPAGSNSGAL